MAYNRQLVAERLGDLRKPGGKTISLKLLSQEIEEKTGVYISATQLNKYENPDKNDIMNVENLIAIADYYDVSYDYLLGKSEAKQRENVDINKRTGLSDESINILEDLWSRKETWYQLTRTIDNLIKNRSLIHRISEYLFRENVEVDPKDIFISYLEKDYDGTYTDVGEEIEFNDEIYKSILLFEIQKLIQEMR